MTAVYGNNHDMNGWDWFVMSVGTVLFWALLITVAVLLYRALTRAPQQPYPPIAPASPEQLLAERFARGEIDEDEYWRRRSVLRSDDVGLTKP
ncbi:putative membrane protein [Streptomyces sp. SAI-208]|uniref:SHOCT domain-containing protein n=1 Tax=unclassified Streptomyces TaxID=2593676 RepID=UPI0024733C30|nr:MULTISPECIES: SHOCT domain-containing protein [unclassified Streptomyces]MDH6514397.1 putative membrane protein [Streptomyces sp. SAI-090]MDH6546577.1 putative membrane protein [Streptomyces sp. SAI-041]MDH6589403.1 putative membrane protein [Streptomyces sp. SAI-133]MDH6605239.1 putative membrane protein [Streptomyces sp. SAI-208]MDH6621521.1 putative membrane protein [Streptomyces sp. SAI-135]